jgi:hypothetical protein
VAGATCRLGSTTLASLGFDRACADLATLDASVARAVRATTTGEIFTD